MSEPPTAPKTGPPPPVTSPEPSAAPLPVAFDDIEAARARIQHLIYRSPLTHSPKLSSLLDARVFLKLENLQMTGSFKERGALNKLLTLTPSEAARGVIAASAGNHAQGLAFHARRLGIQATIVMPVGTPLTKEARTRDYGAEVVVEGANFDESAAFAQTLAHERGLVFVHPFNDPAIIAGQGTIGLELLEDNPYLEMVIVPVGGGGLISGIAVALKETNPRIKVIGVEAARAPGMRASVQAGSLIEAPFAGRTIADGIAVRRVGEHTLRLTERYVDHLVTVDDEDIASAILLLLEQEKTVTEGAAAVTLAALRAGRIPCAKGRRVALILSGGNIDANFLSRIIGRGLARDGRIMAARVSVDDAPGALAHLTAVLSQLKANVIEIHHERNFALLGKAIVEVTLDTRGPDHIATIQQRLQAEGYGVELQRPGA